MKMKTSAAIVLAVGLALSGAAQAASSHNGGGGHSGGGAAAHFSGGGHFGGHGGGHGGHFGHHGGYGGYGYGALGLGLGLGLGALYYDDYYGNNGYDGYGPVARDYHDNYPDDSVPPQDAEQGPPPNVPGYWYRCDDPAGYYPYVGICPHPWQAVPAVPPPPPGPTN